MSRNFYILAGTLFLFSLISLGMSATLFWSHGAFDLGPQGDAPAWRILALLFFFGSALVCMVGTVTQMFEQASRRHRSQQSRVKKPTPPPER